MSTLAVQQQALLDALFAWPPQAASQRLLAHASGVGASLQRGLLAYQSNGHMLAERALRAAYPVLVQMVGEASFADLARAHWHAHPPQCGDISRWGGDLARFIGNSAQLQAEPYLVDLAGAEWELHRCALAPDHSADLGTLALLTTDDPQTLTLVLAPGLATFASAWPLVSLLLAHQQGTPTLAELARQLQARMAQDLVVWRLGFQPQLRKAQPDELPLLRALQNGVALEPALEAAPGLDFAQWLALAVQTGLVLGARRCSRPA
jgi:hypothetical protein